MRRRFATLDVFTARPFAGNPLAVVLDGEGIATETMQAIAREFNHPETVFVLAPAGANARARLRIFTPLLELPFAGHPTVGTAVLLGLQDGAGGQAIADMVLEEPIGRVPCSVERRSARAAFARFVVPQLPKSAGQPADAAAIAAALGLQPEDIGFAGFRPSRWSAGLPFTFVPVRTRTALARARPDGSAFAAAFPDGAAYLFCNETVAREHAFHARMFAPAAGIPEDPATGSAAAALSGVVAASERLREGEHAFVIEQGYEMGRPSIIRLTLVIAAGALTVASIGGDAVVVTEGTIEA